ncbi:MAG TPA: hypothetical protein VGD80_07160, partial [Kofleriaceae bacterium]
MRDAHATLARAGRGPRAMSLLSSRPILALAVAGAAAIALAACSSDTSLPIEPQCNPLGTGHCMTPWPSSVFASDDP